MNKENIIERVKQYISQNYNCSVEELNKTGLNIIKNNEENKLKILLFYDLVLVSSYENLYDMVKEKLTGKNVYEIFEFPYVYGQSIYSIPDLTRLEKQEELPNYIQKFLKPEPIQESKEQVIGNNTVEEYLDIKVPEVVDIEPEK